MFRAHGLTLAPALALVVPDVWAHGGAAAINPWSAGARAVWGEPACVLALLVLALLVAQQVWPRARAAVLAGGLAVGAAALLAAAGVALDFTLELLGLTLLCGGLVAWARPWPPAAYAALGMATAAAVVLVSMPADAPSLAFRLAWLAGVLGVVVVLFGNALLLMQALIGRSVGRIKSMLLRVAGSWFATAALLVLALEWSRRHG